MSALPSFKNPSSTSAVATDVGLTEKRALHAFFRQPGNEKLNAELQGLNQLSNFKSAVTLFQQWLWISLAIFFAVYFSQWWSYLLALPLIASRQHALSVLMHEATHGRLFSNKWANDFFADVFCALPIQMLTSRYRLDHLAHHHLNMQDGDPYHFAWTQDSHWHWPKTKSQALRIFAKDLLGLNLLRTAPSLVRWSPWSSHFKSLDPHRRLKRSERFLLYGFWGLSLAMITWAHAWFGFFVLWMLPLLTWMVAFVRARTIAEHLALPGQTEFNRSRHINASFLEKLFIAPLNIHIHTAHHLFPSVPQYNLPRLHQLLLQYPPYQQQGKIFESYFGKSPRAYDELIQHPVDQPRDQIR